MEWASYTAIVERKNSEPVPQNMAISKIEYPFAKQTLEMNIEGYYSKVDDVIILAFDLCKISLAGDEQIDMGSLPYKPAKAINENREINGRKYRFNINMDGHLYLKYLGGDALPADGKPGIPCSVVYLAA